MDDATDPTTETIGADLPRPRPVRWRRAVAAAPVALLLLAGCGGDDTGDDAAGTTTETTAPDETTTTAAGTTAPPTESTTAPAPQDGADLPTDAEAWMVELVRAWGAGDRAGAARLATAEVVDTLFGYADPGGAGWSLTGCDGAAGSVGCTFETDAGEVLTLLQPTAPVDGGLAPVDRAEITGPGDDGATEAAMGDHASGLVRAWGAGDRSGATTYAHPEVVASLFAIADPGGPGWDLRDCLTGDDPLCIFYDPGRDERLIVRFDATALPGDLVITGVELRPGASG